MVHNDRRLGKRFHRDSAYVACISKRENVGHGLTIVPYLSQVGEVNNHVGILVPAIGKHGNHVDAAANVGKDVSILKSEMVEKKGSILM
jgi:hypothetical protein